MSIQFAIYSSDIAATTDPWTASPAPALLIDLAEEPLLQEYDLNVGSKGRGIRLQTLGGAVDQDFGVVVPDQVIRLAAQNVPLDAVTVEDLEDAFAAVDTQYYFTDTLNVWKCKFVKPDGFKAWRNMLMAANGEDVFSYEILLKVDQAGA
jgi:hypothetical protein